MRSKPVSAIVEPLVEALAGRDLPVLVRFWDGSTLGSGDSPARVVVRSPLALRRLLYQPNELGLSRAYVAGEIDIEGDLRSALALRDLLGAPDGAVEVRLGLRQRLAAVDAARRAGAIGLPPGPPPEECRPRGTLHSKARDAAVVSHHYDVSNEFYRLLLGPSMTYSCAYFPTQDTSLEDAQAAKHDLVCRKLGLEPGMRLLDVGCGWGAMVMHAARFFGVEAVGVTISRNQMELARRRVEEAGLSSKVEIRLQDYRDVSDGPFDAISSIGMFEHVGLARVAEYTRVLHSLLRDRGRLLNHAISRPPGKPALGPRSFISRYVFPDGELHEVGTVVSALQSARLEVRDVESLREHYAITLGHWARNLEQNWQRAVELAGSARARIWRLYITGSSVHFAAGRISVHQVLAVKPDRQGRSGMPATRAAMLGRDAAPATEGISALPA
jgi:cyclopropane-fatty-acyl-phospholipid synthase